METGQEYRKAQRNGQSYFFTCQRLVSPSAIRYKTVGKRISLRAEMLLRRRSEEVVTMQDRLQMSPIAVMFRGKLSGKEKEKGNSGG